jgi:hypothetical protein
MARGFVYTTCSGAHVSATQRELYLSHRERSAHPDRRRFTPSGHRLRAGGYGLSLVQHPLTRFAEFIIGRRFAPTRWQIDISPLGRGEGHTDSN